MKKAFWIYLFLTVIVMIAIFCFSAQIGEKSSDVSMNVTEKIVNDKNYEETPEKPLMKKQEEVEAVVRKIAHFLIFSALGFCSFMTFYYSEKVNKTRVLFIISIVFCIIYASSDEIHQLFVTERSGEIRDVLIDSGGSALGIAIAFIVRKININRKSFG